MQYKLVVTDMDGTLLDDNGTIPDNFWPLLDRLHNHGITFAVASGRQRQTLQHQFRHTSAPIAYIAENGGVVAHGNNIVSTASIPRENALRLLNIIESHPDINWGLVVCRVDGAYASWRDETFIAQLNKYYRVHHLVDNLRDYLNDQVVKLSVYILDDAETVALPLINPLRDVLSPAVSAKHWVDIMNHGTNKGIALTALANSLGLSRNQTLAFGDYLNDFELLEAAGTAVAMANAHPRIKEIADKLAPSNNDHGVITVLERLLTDAPSAS